MTGELVGPPVVRTRLSRVYEVRVHDLYAEIRRRVRAHTPAEALRLACAEIDWELRLDLGAMPATITRLDTGEVWRLEWPAAEPTDEP